MLHNRPFSENQRGLYMWFKNLNLYRLAGSFELSAEALHQQLEQKAFRPCGSMDMATLGWVAPLGHLGEQLAVHGLRPPVMHPESAVLIHLTAA